MRLFKRLLIIGTSLFLGGALLANANQKEPIKSHADGERIFQLQYDPARTTDDSIYNYIGQFVFGFNFMYEDTNTNIFTDSGDGTYMNDHLTLIKDENAESIEFGKGVIINGKTFKDWVALSDAESHSYKADGFDGRNKVHEYPMYNGGVFAPVVIWLKPKRIELRVNLELFPMDDIEVTFKKDFFYAFNGEYTYKLEEDVTFYSSLNSEAAQNASPSQKITFIQQRNEVLTNYGIDDVHVSSEKTATGGAKYHYYQIYTEIIRDETKFNSAVPTDHDRYLYGNILLNGKPLTHYNSYARAKMWDFTDFGNPSDKPPVAPTQNPAYETGHATGSVNIKYDLAARVDLAVGENENPKYIIAVYLSNQFLADFEIGTPVFTLREGSSWFSKDADGNSIIVRNVPSMFDDAMADAILELEDYADLSLYREAEIEAISQLINNASGEISSVVTLDEIDVIVANTKAAIDLVKTNSELTIEEHLAAFKDAVDAIPEELEDEIEYAAIVAVAKELYAHLTSAEKALLDQDDVDKLVEANNKLEALYLYNYKQLAKDEINAEAAENIYRAEQQTAIEEAITTGFAAIDAATTKAEVDTAQASISATIAAAPTAKSLAAAELDKIDLTVYRDEQKEEVQDLIDKAKVLINSCGSLDDIEEALDRTLALIDKVKTNEEMTQEAALAPKKEEAKQELSKYATSKGKANYTTINWTKILEIVDLGQFNIDCATSEKEIQDALAEAKANIDKVAQKEPEQEDPDPGKEDPETPDTPDTPEPTPANNGGCGGSIIASSVLISTLSLIGFGLMTIKRRKQK